MKCPGSTQVDLKKGSVPTTEEKQPRKAPTNRKALPMTSIGKLRTGEVDQALACSTVTSKVNAEINSCGETNDEVIESNLPKERIKELEEALMAEEQQYEDPDTMQVVLLSSVRHRFFWVMLLPLSGLCPYGGHQ